MKRACAFGFCALIVATLWAATPYDSASVPDVRPIEIPANRGAAALWQGLQKLRTRASLIMITAHPDDEDGGMLAYESRGLGARVTLLTLNRGEGGANVMSSDYWDALGLVRTQELLSAGNHYGVDQYFTTVCDYGFSKTLKEAKEKWGEERVLGEVVRIVRTTRPLVVTSVFVGGPSDGHGNHQMAGLMAKEVFDAAGDPQRFPEQIKAGLHPWTPLKYYAHLPFVGKASQELTSNVIVPEGTYHPLLGESYVQLSHLGLGEQKTQNGGPSIPRAGDTPSPYHRYATRVEAKDQEQSFFDGIDVSLAGIADLVHASEHDFLSQSLKEISASVEKAVSSYSAANPERCGPPLADGLRRTDALIEQVSKSNLPDSTRYDALHELQIKRAQFNDALVEALGVSIRANVHPGGEVNPLVALFMGDPDTFRMAIPGQEFQVQLTAASQVDLAVTHAYLESPQKDAFQISAPEKASPQLLSNHSASWRFKVRVNDSAPYTQPYFSRPSIEQPYYDLLLPNDFGRPFSPYPLSAWLDLEYNGVPVRLGQIVQTVQHVTGRGVVYEPLVIGPAISVQMTPQRGIVPLNAASFPLSVNLHSNVKGPANGTLRLHLPEGWKSDPESVNFGMSNDGEDQSVNFSVTPAKLSTNPYEIQAVADYQGHEYKTGYTVTGYSGVLPYYLYKDATYRVSGADVTIAPNLRVAYVTGTGDDVPQTLSELNVKFQYLSASDLASGNLAQYDAILLGVRAYAARPELATNNQRLLEYVKNGGVLIVQYNTPEFDHNFGPYPYKMGEEPEEVTDENSEVTILDPKNPVLQWPNKLRETDFQNWIEERGSKFLTTWDSHYQALLETHDPEQPPQRGGLLYAKYGKGVYVYNAYALYRELPEGVPGAFRLMANLLSLAKNPQR